MTQDPLLPKIGGYVDGELTPAERADVEESIEGSSEYRGVAETLQWVDQVARGNARGEDVPKVSEDEWSRLKEVVLSQALSPSSGAPSSGVTAPGAAAPETTESKTIPFPRPSSRPAWQSLAALSLFGLILAWAFVAWRPDNTETPGSDITSAGGQPPQIDGSGLEETPAADDDRAVDPEEPGFADLELYAPKVDNEDDFTSVFYDDDF